MITIKKKLKTSAAQRAAVDRYEKKFKRVNCRLEPELYDRMVATGRSANSFIVEAVTEKLDRESADGNRKITIAGGRCYAYDGCPTQGEK